jgi:hypothetical protein
MPARDLSTRPNLAQYRKRAKDLLKQWRHGDNEALGRLRQHRPHPPAIPVLADAQLVVAPEHGVESWPRFVKAMEAAGFHRRMSGGPLRQRSLRRFHHT